jgi:predicted NUDIX family phosphoesterase
MSKLALCIPADQVRSNPDQYELKLLPREGENNCENDPTHLQIIPYIVLYRQNQEQQRVEVLSYTRGNKSGEERLVSKKSIGFGGHVETLPEEGTDFITHIAKEAIRELEEELGLKNLTVEMVLEKIKESAVFIVPDDDSTEVEKVHLGIQFFLDVTGMEFGEIEKDVIESLEWLPQAVLFQHAQTQLMVNNQYLNFVYEPWSITAISRIA